jgi:NADP-dependent 3-hydroxy acid dehydrogenase YdfG
MTRQLEVGALQADGSIVGEPTMSVDAVADAVLYMVELPLNANVLSMTVMASGMPFVGRG